MQRLSSELFSQGIAEFDSDERMTFKNTKPAFIVFHSADDNFADGFKEVIGKFYSDNEALELYDVLVCEYPEIPESYNITAFPATMYIPVGGKPIVVQGYTSSNAAIKDLAKYILAT